VERLGLSEIQADAILDLRLYRLAKLEIEAIRTELAEKRAEAARLEALLGDEGARWKLIRAELLEVKTDFGDRRRSKISGTTKEPEYDAEAFIVDEDAVVLLSAQGWVKRQGRVTDVSSTRVRDGDRVQDVVAGSTRSSVAFFSNLGSCYVCRLVDVPPTTGYGNPVQTLFKLADGERIVRMLGFDPRVLDVPEATEDAEEPEPPLAIAISRGGMATRFSLRAHRDPSTRSGRKYMRLGKGGEVVEVAVSDGQSKVAVATVKSYVLLTTDDEIPVLGGPGKGVKLIRLGEEDRVLGARVMTDSSEPLVVKTAKGKTAEITVWRKVTGRGGKGTALFKSVKLLEAIPLEPTVPELGSTS
jgi:DNA gyrase subunit A